MCIFKCTGLVFVMKVSEIIVYSGIDFNVQFKVNTKPKELLMGIECLLSILFFTALWTEFTVGLIQRNVGHMVIMIIQLAWSQNNSCYCFLFWGFQTFYTITEQASIFVVVAPFC